MGLIDTLVDFFMVKSKPISHPFRVAEAPVQEEEVQEEESTVEITLWGRNKTVKANVTQRSDGIEYEITNDKSKLKLIDLDEFDRQVIVEYNKNPKNAKQQILSANYKLVKPYVLSKRYTYKEISLLIEPKMSISTLQRIGPRIKEAAKRRQNKTTPTP